jgi:hypothetical protein
MDSLRERAYNVKEFLVFKKKILKTFVCVFIVCKLFSKVVNKIERERGV